MFKKSRKKIVVAIMSVLILLLFGTLTVIYGFSYSEVFASNQEMLQRYAQLYSLENQPGSDMLSENREHMDVIDPIERHDNPEFENMPAFQLSTFYSVAVSDDGDILAIDNDDEVIYDDEQLKEYAFTIIDAQKNKGIKENLIYITMEKDGYTLVAFMDNTIMQESITTLFRYTCVFGIVAIFFFFFVAVYLAKKIVQPLEQSYQKQKQFISDAGHELKTPVSVVSANAELLSREMGENQWLSNIQYESERMGKLVGQLLELARTENVAMQTEYLDFSYLVQGEALPFEGVAFDKGLTLNCNIANNLFIYGNSSQLKQLVSILLDNAIRHSTNGREVILSLEENRKHVILSVINNGNPISQEQREKLFERFYRVDTVRNSENRHYGLGLAIAKAVVEAHKGKIEVLCYDNKIEFIVRIPVN